MATERQIDQGINTYDLVKDVYPEEYPREYEARDIVNFLSAGHSAAPLLITGPEQDDDIIASQDQLHDALREMTYEELGQLGVKPSVIKWTAEMIDNRLSQREAFNGTSFMHRLFRHPEIGRVPDVPIEQVVAACDAARTGTGSIQQNRIAQLSYGMESGEYANLTIVGGQRKEFEAEMWKQASDMIGRDVSDLSEGVYRTEIVGFDRDICASQHLGAMRVSSKRYLDTGDYDTELKVRETVIIDTSPASGIDATVIKAIRSAVINKQKPEETLEFQRLMNWLWSSNMDSSVVLARNETIYGASNEIRQEVEESLARKFGRCSGLYL